jgi:hypothetical protein
MEPEVSLRTEVANSHTASQEISRFLWNPKFL